MKNTLFNEEVEGFTHQKYSTIKLTILAIALFAFFAFGGWLMNIGGHLISYMDAYVDTQVEYAN